MSIPKTLYDILLFVDRLKVVEMSSHHTVLSAQIKYIYLVLAHSFTLVLTLRQIDF